ncbi:unnamed protein product [Brassica rapa]|uniref:Uncharacterized protein n=1 Tax=Brassica campestris TaxID=3711 RepID=A0A8D9HNN4_BRACM|nr:unnamed protein product [Brassica rapa]
MALTEMIINHNLGFHNLRPVQTSSMTSPTHHCSIHNRLLELSYDVGVRQFYGGSSLAFLIYGEKDSLQCNFDMILSVSDCNTIYSSM